MKSIERSIKITPNQTETMDDTEPLSQEAVHVEQSKAVLNRMSRLVGHMEAVRKMVESGRDSKDVLIQLSAVRSAIQGLGRVILKEQMENCRGPEAIHKDHKQSIEEMKQAVEWFVR